MVTTGKGAVILKAIESPTSQDIDQIFIRPDQLAQNNDLIEDAIERVILGVRGQPFQGDNPLKYEKK